MRPDNGSARVEGWCNSRLQQLSVYFCEFFQMIFKDLLHLIENTFDLKRIYADHSSCPNPNINLNPNYNFNSNPNPYPYPKTQ